MVSCKKDTSADTLTPQEEEQAAIASTESDAQADGIFDDVFNNVMGVNNDVGMAGTGEISGRTTSVGNTGGSITGRETNIDSVGACYTVTITHTAAPAFFPVRIVTDFGQTGCVGRDGRRRYGKIITVYTNRLVVPGATATTTFDGYRVDSITVRGTHTITNVSTANVRQFNVDVVNGKLSRPSGDFNEWASHKEIKQVEGLGTPDYPFDDVFTISGHANGTVKRSTLVTTWTSNITTPLRKRFLCHWISSGVVRIVRNGLPNNSPWIATLDYGNGACDNIATFTLNGVSHQITLP
ncbi:MAG: hypothetical protein C4329_06195 [Chitinophagaceae bacterium]